MSKEQIDLIFKMLPINLQLDNIFLVFSQAYDKLKQQKKDMKKDLDIRDIDVRIKLTVIYNDFRSIFPDLCGNISRITMIPPKHYPFLKCILMIKERKFIS
jgi:hypothetical protein